MSLTKTLLAAIGDLVYNLGLNQEQISTIVRRSYMRPDECGDETGCVNAVVRMHVDLMRTKEITEALYARIQSNLTSSKLEATDSVNTLIACKVKS